MLAPRYAEAPFSRSFLEQEDSEQQQLEEEEEQQEAAVRSVGRLVVWTAVDSSNNSSSSNNNSEVAHVVARSEREAWRVLQQWRPAVLEVKCEGSGQRLYSTRWPADDRCSPHLLVTAPSFVRGAAAVLLQWAETSGVPCVVYADVKTKPIPNMYI